MTLPLPLAVTGYDGELSLEGMRAVEGILDSGTVTPSDTVMYGNTVRARWLYVGVTGNVTLIKWDGTLQLYKNVAGGVAHPFHSIGVMATGTTATDMVWGN